MAHGERGPITYWDYIRLDDLIGLQGGREGDEASLTQDEVLFITVHQVYELWFKLLLRDLVAVRDVFAAPHVPEDALGGARRLLARARVLLEVATEHFRLVESITSRDFLTFRDKLFPANGGQSPQFREVEIMFGLAEAERIPYVTGGSYLEAMRAPDGSESAALARVRARLADRPSLKEAVDGWLHRTPIGGSVPAGDGDDKAVRRFVDGYLEVHARAMRDTAAGAQGFASDPELRATLGARYDAEIERAERFLRALDVPEGERARRSRIRAAVLFIELYRELPLLAWPREIVEGLVALEQAFVFYRQRHARMAERVIGRRVGTGGSSGVEYLDQSALAYRVFGDLWGVRTLLVRRDLVPDPERPELYGFRFGER